MGYIEDNLVPGERIVFRTKLHSWVIINMFFNLIILVLLLAILGYFLLLSSAPKNSRNVTTDAGATVTAICICGLPFILIALLFGFLAYRAAEFGLTDRRVMIKTGIIRRHTLELNLRQVESFQVRETIIGRIAGFKTIILTGSGGTKEIFRYVARAGEFQKKVIEFSTNAQTHNEIAPPVLQGRSTSSILDKITLPSENTQQLILDATRHIQSGNRQVAQQIIKGLMQSDPNNADVWYLAGYLSSTPEKKRQAFERALRIDPTHKKALQAIAAL